MKKRNKIILIAGAGAAALIIGVSVANSPGGDGSVGHGTVSEVTDTPKPKHSPSGPATSFRDGTFKVGVDIKTGTYKTDGKSHSGISGDYCYWARAKDDSGELDAIIANDFSKGPNRVTVHAGEYFHTTGECDWKLVSTG